MSSQKDNALAVIFGCSGLAITAEEKSFFHINPPAGFILFARNIESPAQVRALVASLKAAAHNPHALILIDQEGGRVARLKPPHWRASPAAAAFRMLAEKNIEKAQRAVRLNYQLIGAELYDLGITVDCAPMLDILTPGAHEIVGDRSFGDNPEIISLLGKAACEGLLEEGVLPVIKHIPGHGRARVDSHESLPAVETPLAELQKTDFVPFRKLAGMPLAMTAHITYTDIDPNHPATLSPEVIRIIREDIGFKGLLITDDLSMKALSGDLGKLAQQSLRAGCDLVLHCNGRMEEMKTIAASIPKLSDQSTQRLTLALGLFKKPRNLNENAEDELCHLLG